MTDRPPIAQRYARRSDGPAVGSYHVRCWQTAYRGLIADVVIDAMNVEENIERWTGFFGADPAVTGYQHVVALIDDVPVGHVSVAPARDLAPDGGDGIGELVVCYVDPDHQARGVGSELLTTAHRMLRLRGFERAVLWTVVGNEPAIGFYEKHGWFVDGTTRQEPFGADVPPVNEVRLSIDLTASRSHIQANREHWDGQADGYAIAGEKSWAGEPAWGIFGIPDAEVGILPDVADRDVVELGCGTAYVSAWCARAGARSVIGIDNSPNQLTTAKRLQSEHRLNVPLIWGDAEHLPLAEASFDVAISEYGAAIWCDPHLWIAEAARVLRPGGTLVFLGNSVLAVLAANDFEGETATNELLRPQRGLHHLEWPDTDASEFHVSHGDMIKILRRNGFEVLDLIELYAPPGASTTYTFLDAEWASKWPHEEVWVARKQQLME